MDSFIARVGGKKLLRKEIISRFPAQFDRYIEVFGGAGWVLFGADKHAKMEVFNDIDGELVNLFRIVKYHPETLQKEIEWLLNSREQFKILCATPPEILTDIQRAARYYMITRTSYAAKGNTYSCSVQRFYKPIDNIRQFSNRLKDVIIEHKSYADLIKVYDRKDALFYCDPPYYGAEKYYTDQFSEDDHIHLKECLEAIKGRFILSYNDTDFIRNLYDGYNVERVSRHNCMSLGHQYNELIIRNYT